MKRPSQQQGVTLVVALLLLLVVTISTLSAVRFSMSEMRIAANEQLRLTSFQNTQSVADSLAAIATMPTTTAELFCTAGIANDPVTGTACTSNAITVPNSYLATEIADGRVSATMRYNFDLEIQRIDSRRSFAVSSGDTDSGDELGAGPGRAIYSYYTVGVNYMRSEEGLGQTQLQQGMRVRRLRGGS
jgi:Tfp pilus assembly protein PilX